MSKEELDEEIYKPRSLWMKIWSVPIEKFVEYCDRH